MTKTSSYRDDLLADLTDPAEAAAYLNAALEDSQEAFLVAMRNVAQARQMATVAKSAGVQRESLYRSLSEGGNPTLSTLSSVLNGVGLRLAIEQAKPSKPRRKRSSSPGPTRSRQAA